MNDAPMIHLLGISGSLRAASFNTALLRAAGALAPAGTSFSLADISDLPFYDGDVEATGDPPPVERLKVQIRAADALLIATPEYNGSISGILHTALDWASRPHADSVLRGKPVAIVSASPGGFGGVRAQETLRRILTATRADVLAEPVLALGRAGERIGATGDLVNEPDRALVNAPDRALLAALVADLVAHVRTRQTVDRVAA